LDEVLLVRSFSAHPWKVFNAWIYPSLLAHWWGPEGTTHSVCKVDPTRGGEIYLETKDREGASYFTSGHFVLIDQPEQIVFTTKQYLDENQEVLLKLRHTVIFLPEGYKTRLTLHSVVMRSTERAVPWIHQMEEGWQESFDKLEKLLIRLRISCFHYPR